MARIPDFFRTSPGYECLRHAFTGAIVASLYSWFTRLSSRPENGHDLDSLRRSLDSMCIGMPLIGAMLGSLIGLMLILIPKKKSEKK